MFPNDLLQNRDGASQKTMLSITLPVTSAIKTLKKGRFQLAQWGSSVGSQ